MKRTVICAFVVLSGASIGYADDQQTACLSSALDTHLAATTKLFDAAGPLMSPDAQMTRRRLDEKYCLAVTECGLTDQTGDARAMMASALFSSCLKKKDTE
ncbi:hypothetical protein [Pseudorhizobium pelagicum]|uniref:Uncharacterized protein n=1 Tax=Pseudorhizobium pelagicum TaxID=1509405 RepID=A0A922P2Q8_9HYPH|nr:hypothetical protein [Pseudorhizobium pelagicum]KEQ08058.1 hypothetical protein GV67_17875 [Pseudorhizobium pelagicum]KEQ10255.1 hypothetical protein GV68_15145 [Pseudorhizobium pelagicum]